MIEVKVEGLNRLIRLAEQFPQIAEPHINTAITRSLTRIWGAEKREAPFGVAGQLRDNWVITTARFQGTLASNMPYALFVEKGTGPHMPPIDAITPWAKKKGLNPWAVAMSIKKKGTKANPFLSRAIDDAQSGIEQEFEDALNATLAEVNSLPDT